jgi:hypothetical protein
MIAALASNIVFFIIVLQGWFPAFCRDQWVDVANGSGSCTPSDDGTHPRQQERAYAAPHQLLAH